MMRAWITLLFPLAWFLQVPGIQVKEIQTTPTQAVIVFQAPDVVSCTVKVAYDAAFTRLVHDTNSTLFPGSQNCGRTGNFIQGNTVTFVAGLRRAQKASDEKFYSRALENNHTFWYQITSGGQSVTGKLNTKNPPIGNAYGDVYPFDADAPGHYAWPTIDWSTTQTEYVDPLSGVLLKRMTSQGLMLPGITAAAVSEAALGTEWTNPQNAVTVDGTSSGNTGTGVLFLRAPEVCPQFYVCERTGRWDDPYESVDDIEISLKAWCSSSNCASSATARKAEICLTVDGVNCRTPWKPVTLGTSSGSAAIQFPSGFPTVMLKGWLNAETPIARGDMATLIGKVNTSGTTVTWASGHTFAVGAWGPGSRIKIGNVEYVIANVDGATSLTLETSAGTQTNADFRANNFGMLIRKAAASADLFEVDGATFRYAFSQEFEMRPSGAREICGPNKVFDAQNREGFMCAVNTPDGYWSLWFISTSDGDAKYLGMPRVPYNIDVSGGNIDGNFGDCLQGFALSFTNPNQFFCVVGSSADPYQGLLIFRGTYHPEGRAGCSDAGGYQGVASGETCLITWEYMTKPSQQRTVFQQAAVFDNRFQVDRFPFNGMFGVRGRYMGFFAWAAQDTMAWTIWLDTTTFRIVSMQNYHSNRGCRFCAVHSLLPLGDDNYHAVVVKNLLGGTDNNSGPYESGVTAATGSSDGSLSANALETCPDDIAPEFKTAGAVGNKCVTLTLQGDPCDPDPSTWELANLPACPWNPSARTLQPILLGDEAADGPERFLFVKSLGNNRWVLMRNHGVNHGTALAEFSSSIAAHPAGWKLTMVCSGAVGSGHAWVDIGNDAHGTQIFRDKSLARAEHGDISSLGSVMSVFFGESSGPFLTRFGRAVWNLPLPQRANTAAVQRYITGRVFGNVDVSLEAAFRGFIQTHPSWRQVTAPPKEKQWFLDGNPFAGQSGGDLRLWNQSAVRISGDLYRLGTPLASPLSRKMLPTLAWSGRQLMQDISGPGSAITGATSDNWKYCVADFSGECVAGSSANDIYVNAPSMTVDGICGKGFYFNRPCFISMVNLGIGINQYGVREYKGFNGGDRHLTSQMQRYNATWTYDNAVPLPDASWAITGGTLLDGVRSDLLLMKLPPYPEEDSVNRQYHVPVHVSLGGFSGSTSVRARFGYAENGPVDSYYCTSRKEACTTGGSPFTWLSEAQTPVSCPSSGCTVNIPGISGRVVYYVIDRLNSSGVVIDSQMKGAVAVP